MPVYRFKRLSDGKPLKVKLSFDQLMQRQKAGGFIVLPDGTEAVRDVGAELEAEPVRITPKGKTRVFLGANWGTPLASDGMGVHPSQAKEFNEQARKAGITGVYYDPKDGTCYCESRSARKREQERRHQFDKNGGFGDSMPRYA